MESEVKAVSLGGLIQEPAVQAAVCVGRRVREGREWRWEEEASLISIESFYVICCPESSQHTLSWQSPELFLMLL